MGPETRLATYGTLAPGQVNAHVLAPLNGQWSTGVVRGELVEEGWGAAHGCPGIVLTGNGQVDVHLFTSTDLPQYWDRLDTFEGPGYRRVPVSVETADGTVEAFIYEVLAASP
ncbi:MAG: gamma-glutamylcyclotransferase [Paracoccaceae bacterium]